MPKDGERVVRRPGIARGPRADRLSWSGVMALERHRDTDGGR